MGIILFVIVLILFGIVLRFWKNDSLFKEFLEVTNGIIIGAVILILIIISIELERGFQEKIYNYNSLKTVIETQRIEDLSGFERVQIIDKIIKTNNMINIHIVYKDSFWVGIWHSEEISKLEYLK